MTADNRTNEPNQNETKSGQEFCFTEAQVEAASKAHRKHGKCTEYMGIMCRECDEYFEDRAGFEAHRMRAAIVAAAGAAPDAESADNVTCRCGHGVGAHDFSDPSERCRMVGCRCQGWFGVAPVLPSSTVDEGKIEQAAIAGLDAVNPTWRATGTKPSSDDLKFARAVVEAIGGEGRAARE